MQVVEKRRLLLFSGGSNQPLAEEVAKLLDVEMTGLQRSVFANGEIYVRSTESVRGCDCFVLQSHTEPLNFNIMEQLITIDALKRASARAITAVMPFYGYSRQDKKGRPREPITAKLIADLMHTAGADRIVSVDLHTGQLQGFSNKPFDHLTAMPVLVDYLAGRLEGPTTVVSPDAGGVKRAERFARHLGAEVAFVYKRRDADRHNESTALAVVGEVEGRNAVIVDDMIDTAGTVANAASMLRDRGATSVRVVATHGIFSPPAAERLRAAPIDEVVVTNTLPIRGDMGSLESLTVISVAPIVAEALEAIFQETSVSKIFLGENV
jgi:ribose-phosphate pyrophosphokinase